MVERLDQHPKAMLVTGTLPAPSQGLFPLPETMNMLGNDPTGTSFTPIG